MREHKRFYTVIISIVVLLGFFLTSLIGYFVAKNSISQRLQGEMLPLTSDNIYSEIQRDLLRPILISSLMANDTFVFDWVRDGELELTKIQDYLALIQQRYDTVTAFFASEKTLNYYHPTGIVRKLSTEGVLDDWYFSTRDSQALYEINIDRDIADRSRSNIFVNYRVIDTEGQFLGVIGVGLEMRTVAELIENYQQRYGREIYFVSQQGEMMLHSSQYHHGNVHMWNKIGPNILLSNILTENNTSASYQLKNSQTLYINSRYVPEFDWYLIVEQVSDPASERIETALWINLGISLLISALVLIIAHYALRGYQGRLEMMATRDKLTGAVNRQIFESLFEQAKARAKRQRSHISIVVFDIDHFKQINDSFGHRAGDRVLVKIVELIRARIREEDILCRWGGEEFVLMLQGCALEQAVPMIDNIRLAIEENTFQFSGQSIKVTSSAGLAQYQMGETLASVVDRADVALYRAKKAGRNTIISG